MDFFLSRKLSGRRTLNHHTVFTVVSPTLAATRTSCPPGELSRRAQSQRQSKDNSCRPSTVQGEQGKQGGKEITAGTNTGNLLLLVPPGLAFLSALD